MSKALIYTAFHLNLAFSSIEEDQRKTVIENCYWPLLRLAEDGFPIGIEATSFTLREILSRDPEWIDAFRSLLEQGKVELIGSGYTQMIAPLMPADMTAANLRLGLQDYGQILGVTPRVAMVNEQAYAPGLVPIYLDAGFEAIIMDWSEPSSHNRSWSRKYAHRPQLVAGTEGGEIPVIWSDALSFQKFQRYAHAEIEADEYFEFLGMQLENGAIAFPLYTSDAEVFDYRPGRFASEAKKSGAVTEYERIALLLSALRGSDVVTLGTPSDALAYRDEAGSSIRLETAHAPVPVKKQRKYNLLRWGVSGRNDLTINTACYRVYDEVLKQDNVSEHDWRHLCELWASDYRTHITNDRWQGFLAARNWRSGSPENTVVADDESTGEIPDYYTVSRNGRFLIIDCEDAHLALNCGRGLSIQSFGAGRYEAGRGAAPSPNGLVGTLAHGFFEDIAYGADFYSGHFVFEPANSHKVTDLVKVEPEIRWRPELGVLDVIAKLVIAGETITKTVRFEPKHRKITVWYHGKILPGGPGAFRCAHVTLNPHAFDRKTLYFSCANGGRSSQKHKLWEDGLVSVDHGAPVSRLVSATTGLGLTDGILEMGDARHCIRLCMARTDAAGLGLITSKTVGDSFFVRAAVTLGESDETSRTLDESDRKQLPDVFIRYSIEFDTVAGH